MQMVHMHKTVELLDNFHDVLSFWEVDWANFYVSKGSLGIKGLFTNATRGLAHFLLVWTKLYCLGRKKARVDLARVDLTNIWINIWTWRIFWINSCIWQIFWSIVGSDNFFWSNQCFRSTFASCTNVLDHWQNKWILFLNYSGRNQNESEIITLYSRRSFNQWWRS